MGDRDFIKPILERQGTVHFGKVLPPILLCLSLNCSPKPFWECRL